ncbi:MAG: metallophosphoesterase [Deltaproteobacteria bacterium]|nr:metallophosphoesterase [Deltaproteobacteria bacterium]
MERKGANIPGKEIKIGVLSDTHLHEVTRELKEISKKQLADIDLILHAGDVVSREILDFLSKKTFHGVYGNMDPFEIRSALPRKKIVEVGAYRLGLIHGWGAASGLEDHIRSEFQGVDAIIYGHSHRPVNHVREGVLFFNPGTATGYSSEGRHTMGILEVGDTIRGEIVPL